MASEYSLRDVLERLYENQLALEAAAMKITFGQNIKAHPRLEKMFGDSSHDWGKCTPY